MNQPTSPQPTPGTPDAADARRLHVNGVGPDWDRAAGASARQVFYGGGLGASVPCPTCGIAVATTAPGCPNCGATYYSPRSKRTAVALAVLLTFWTWYYTYRKDRWKFWIGLAIDTLALFLHQADLGFVMLTGIWVWAIVDAMVKPAGWYRRYPSRR
ncbi:MAG: hypothetical protein M0007_12340 [Actinomycetota bacterium]|nr:hypothetical protein [Actinomycetota bacterium]